jgi:transposase
MAKAIVDLVCSGCAWRMRQHHFPPSQSDPMA